MDNPQWHKGASSRWCDSYGCVTYAVDHLNTTNCNHLDFEKTFIQAIVYNYKVLKEEGDEATVKAKGKVMTKGKDYVVEDGDILLIKAGAAKS